jgi:hypothetical protein
MSRTIEVRLKDGTKKFPSRVAFCAEYDLPYELTQGRLNNDWTPEECIDPTLKTDSGKHKTDYTKTSRYSPKATEERRVRNHAKWIKRATKKHGDKFCYQNTLTDFKTAKKPDVKIICLEHSVTFYIVPDKHITLENGGCEHCWKEQVTKDSIERQVPKFLEWFNANLAGRFETRSDFKGWGEPILLYCKAHKTVNEKTTPTALKNNGAWGCRSCEKESTQRSVRLNIEKVKNKVSQTRTLPTNITLMDVIFDKTIEESRIIYSCALDEHGLRPAVSLSHLKKSPLICDLCMTAGGGTAHARYLRFIENGEDGDSAVIGVMQVDVEGAVGLKVGVTTRTLEERYGYALKVIFFKLESKERHVYFIENRVKRKFAHFTDNTILGRGLRGELKGGKRWGGDTEVFQKDNQQEIIDYIAKLADDIKSNQISELEYKEEADNFISIDFEPRDVSREKDMSNQPIAVVGIDTQTNEIKYQLDSISDAEALGFKNISTLISEKDERRSSKGIRWFKKSDFDPDNIPPMREKMIHRKPVRCIETGEVFRTAGLAEKAMRSPEHLVSAPKITSVCRGHREKAGGYSWEYANEEQ